MKRRTQQTIAAFAITGIALAALCGFAVVELSTDRYVTIETTPLFQVLSVDEEGVRFALLGERYLIESGALDNARERLWQYRGFLPNSVTLTGNLTAKAYIALQEYREAREAPQTPW